MTNPALPTLLFCAMSCEAKPLIAQFKLKKDLGSHPFEMFRNRDGNLFLTVTGIGKCAMAAGLAYTMAKTAVTVPPILLNVGIAGHPEFAIGESFLAAKIVDSDTGKVYYPPLALTPLIPRATIRTSARPQLEYVGSDLFDMEASAFYETGCRFSTGELIQCIKVVSDNRQQQADNLRPNQVTELIAAQVLAITQMMCALQALQAQFSRMESRLMPALLARYRLSESEKQQLFTLVQRWECLTLGEDRQFDDSVCRNGKALLARLSECIDALEVRL